MQLRKAQGKNQKVVVVCGLGRNLVIIDIISYLINRSPYRKINRGSGPFRRPWPRLRLTVARWSMGKKSLDQGHTSKEPKGPQGIEKNSIKGKCEKLS